MPPLRREKTGTQARAAPYAGKATGKGKQAKGASYAGTASLPTNKKHGQHLLKNPGIVDKIVAACDLKPSDTVFEIGPGTGNLTVKLVDGAKRVLAYEIDPRMACEVRKRVLNMGRTNLEVQEQDVLKAKWPAFNVCAANLPYQISSPFTFRILAHRPAFRCAVLMFQKEFAERLIAKVGEKQYGRLAVNVRLFVKVSCVCKVSRGSFNPPPEVDSMVVKLVPRDPPIQVNFREWDGLMRICFGRKNKTLRSSFNMTYTVKMLEDNYKTWCVLTGRTPAKTSIKELVMEVLNSLEMAELRAIRIDLDAFFKLLLEFNKRGIHFSNMSAGAKIGENPEDEGKAPMLPDESFFDDCGDGDADAGMDD